MNDTKSLSLLQKHRDEASDTEKEIQRLVACYGCSNTYERLIVWAVLNKYAPLIGV